MNQTYIVKKGDTLYGISNQFGVSVSDLANLNNVTAQTLKEGQVLKIPNTSGTNPDTIFMYKVQKGDSLYSIAKKYNTTVNEIIKLNNLKSNNLSIGQILRIPEKYSDSELTIPNYINYVVKKGDSLYKIAKDNNLSVDIIIKDNNLSNNNLSIGQNLKIRINKDEILECFGEDYISPNSNNYEIYTVKIGDNLYSIANRYNTSVDNIKKINNLSTNNLSIGQVLKIPISSNINNIYVVKKGDSLYSIARKFNTTVDNIIRKNNLSSNILMIGQKLNI